MTRRAPLGAPIVSSTSYPSPLVSRLFSHFSPPRVRLLSEAYS